MALRMICVDAEIFAALGLLVSGMPDVVAAACNATKAIPVLIVKGTADPIVPHAGGLVANVLPVWPTERLVTSSFASTAAADPLSRRSCRASIRKRSRSIDGRNVPARPSFCTGFSEGVTSYRQLSKSARPCWTFFQDKVR